jgi:exodeoxyribonuclease V beta subunit
LLPKVRHWPYWQVSSYSRLTQQLDVQRISASEFRLLEDLTLERQAVFDDDSYRDLPLFQISAIETPWQSLPAGAGVGDLMHLALEAMLMESPIGDPFFWLSFWQQQLTYHQLPLTLEADFHLWLTTLAEHPIRLVSSESNPVQFTLNQLNQGSFWCEMGFTLPLSQTHSQAIDECVSAMVLAGAARPKLSYQRLGGLLTGFMDLVFEHDGLYYVLDYKTNKLMQGYDDWSCQQGILSHRYDVQAMLYVLALHRHLSTRLANYDYDRHMGGAIYWFIRGADPQQPQQGIWQCKPSLAELESLSHIFSSQSL